MIALLKASVRVLRQGGVNGGLHAPSNRVATMLHDWLILGRVSLRLVSLLALLLLPVVAMADDEQAAADAYESATQAINGGNFRQALQTLRQLQRDYPSYSNIAGVKTRVAILHEADFAGAELGTFLTALSARDAGDAESAISLLQSIVSDTPDSPLVDDAIYLIAYVQLMERFDYDAALSQLRQLDVLTPDTAYTDAADYLEAIAYEQSGRTTQAIELFEALRARHTSVSLPFGYRIAKGNVLSRYWFDRADRRLEMLGERQEESTTLTSRNTVSENELHLSVLVSGVEVDLILEPSSITQSAQWRDGALRDSAPPSVGVFSGHVKGDEQSWARVVVSDNDIQGVIMQDGVEHRLHSEDLIGTLDYYQPKHRAGAAIQMGGSEDMLPLMLDTLATPPVSSVRDRFSLKAADTTDMRVVPMSIVIDSQYNRYYNGEALLQAVSGLNVADEVYRSLGLTLQLDESIVIDDSSVDPMALGPTTLETMLRNFRTFRQERVTMFDDSALVYLFTGNPKTDITLGLAWIDTACRTDGFDVGVTTPSGFGDVLLTHELGHSLGAQHDTDTECSGINGKLMSPRISGNTDTNMSDCSRSSIVNSVNRSCFLDALDLALDVSQIGNAVALNINNLDSSTSVNAQLNVEVDSSAGVTWPDFCEAVGPGTVECRLSDIAPAGSATVSVSFDAASEPRLTAQVSSFDTYDPTPSNNSIALNTESTPPVSNSLLAVNEFNDGSGSDRAEPQASAASGGGVISWIWLAGLAAGSAYRSLSIRPR